MNKQMEAVEVHFSPTDVIVSATDPQGILLYANDAFVRLSGYSRKELMGKPHSILRHPDMPKAIFQLLWNKLLGGESLYAFVKNRTKQGNYYWVKAYAVPVKNNGITEKFISYRQPLNNYAKATLTLLYATLVEYEKTHSSEASLEFFVNYLDERNMTYNDFIDRLTQEKEVTSLEALQIDFAKFYNDHIIYKSHVEHKVALGEENIELEDACSCKFGKWIDTVKHENYTKHTSWTKMLKSHEQYHEKLNEYVLKNKQGSSPIIIEEILKDVEKSTKTIFSNLQDAIDHCE